MGLEKYNLINKKTSAFLVSLKLDYPIENKISNG